MSSSSLSEVHCGDYLRDLRAALLANGGHNIPKLVQEKSVLLEKFGETTATLALNLK